jgi:phosphoglycolate phosphatase-like HAD superfamily hydrolase
MAKTEEEKAGKRANEDRARVGVSGNAAPPLSVADARGNSAPPLPVADARGNSASPLSAAGAKAAGAGFDWRSFDAYLFDIDGTLLNSRDGVHYEAFMLAMREMYGRQVGMDGVPVQGSTDPIILLAALERAGVCEAEGRAGLDEAMARMCAEVEARADELRPELCGAVPRLLAELRSAGKLLGVTSGNIERIGWAKLKAAGIGEYFSFGSFSDRNESRTEIFRWGAEEAKRRLGGEARVCFVGDTPADVASAKACGFPVIAVATGIFSTMELAKGEPEMCIPGCEALWGDAR